MSPCRIHVGLCTVREWLCRVHTALPVLLPVLCSSVYLSFSQLLPAVCVCLKPEELHFGALYKVVELGLLETQVL